MKIGILDAKTLGPDIDLSPINACGDVVVYDLTHPEEIQERIKDLDVVLTNKVILNESNLSNTHNLKFIGLFATGYNNIDIEYAKSRGIAVANVAGYSTNSVAQHTFAMLLYLMEKLGAYDASVKNREYEKSDTFTFIAHPFYELSGKVLGIIGLGTIGLKVAKIAEAFDMKVIYYSTTGKNNNKVYERVSLNELLQLSDVVSIHAPYNKHTHNLIGYDQLKQMKPSSYLVNVGRGNIVNEADLTKALNEKLIAGAALDVLSAEPIHTDNPLYDVQDKNKLLITPHIAWASIEARRLLVDEIVKNIKAFQKGDLRNRVV